MAEINPLIMIRNADVSRSGSFLLHDATWSLQRGEHWAVLGPNGAGKTTFLKLLRGDIRPDQHFDAGRPEPIIYHFDAEPQTSPIGVRRRIGLVSAEMQEIYRKQKRRLTGQEAVLTGFFDSVCLYEKPRESHVQRAEEIIHHLAAERLAKKELPAMSQGELRIVLIARALAALRDEPALLVLDEVCEGLDAAARKAVLQAVEAAASNGPQILFATHRKDEIPALVNKTLVLRSGKIVYRGPPEGAPVDEPVFSAWSPAAPVGGKAGAEEIEKWTPGEAIITMQDVDVYVERKQVLFGLSWTIKDGERWALVGENGAGKTTLLKLLRGEEHPAWPGKINRFGRVGPHQEDDPVPLPEVRKEIGYVSADLQTAYVYDVTGRDLVLSGFTDSIGLYAEPEPAMKAAADEWIRFFGLEHKAELPASALSTGLLRRFFLARAMVREPSLLLLDEPCAGLDASAREHFLALLSALCRQGRTVVYVTHYPDELVPEIDHVLMLHQGTIRYAGPKEGAGL